MIIENIIDKQYQHNLENTMTSLAFPWFFNKWVDEYNLPVEDDNVINSFQLSHVFYDAGASMPTYNLVEPLIKRIVHQCNISRYHIVRVKANLTTQHNFGLKYQVPHVDTTPPCRSIIYYVNHSDGDTVLFNERLGQNFNKFTIKQESSPVKGSIFSFDGSHYHAGRFPTAHKTRIVINIVLK